MSTSMEHIAGRELIAFDPRQSAEVIAKADALIELANKLKDWPLLERAVDAKIKEQQQFVGWWDGEGPGAHHGGDRSKFADAQTWSIERAEAETGIRYFQASRWRTHLAHEDAYRERMLAVMRRAAKAKDWPLLHEAVDIKIQDQREFIAEWDAKVKEGRPSADGETLTRSVRVSVLEKQSGIAEKQASRWRAQCAPDSPTPSTRWHVSPPQDSRRQLRVETDGTDEPQFAVNRYTRARAHEAHSKTASQPSQASQTEVLAFACSKAGRRSARMQLRSSQPSAY
jgi:hypothetical protein